MNADERKQSFIDWAYQTQTGPKQLVNVKKYASVLERISSIIGTGIGLDRFFDVASESQFAEIRARIEGIPNYMDFNRDYQNGIISAALNLFAKFIKTSNHNPSAEEWYPSLSNYNPNISKELWLDFLKNSGSFNDNYKQMMAAMISEGGQASCAQLSRKYGDTAAHYNMTATHMAEQASEYLHKSLQIGEDGKKRYWSFLFVGKNASSDEPGSFIWKLRAELFDALNEYGVADCLKNRIGSFFSWDIISETVAQKHCDKSFFADNGSGVPKEICWFFDAENIQPGEKKKIKLWYGLQHSYTGHLSNDSTDRRRVRIFWESDLGKQFDAYQTISDVTAKFTKKDTDTYEIEIEGSEKEMTVKDQLAQIKEYIAMRGFSYEGNLIDNFWLSLKSKPFVLLAGTSGTGKTRLVRLFAEAVGATTENGRYKLVSVRPDWSDSSDLFGHVDLNGRFVPGAIIDFVKQAELNPSYPYFLCLDEMNLARVEYYLSDFLSVIETRDRKNGKIVTDPLVDTTYYGKDESAAGKYGKVILPDNLYVIGTVNMDETTFPFSRKVLDRANTIEFSYVNLNTLPSAGDEHVEPLKLENTFLKTEYLSLKECMSEQANFQGLCDRLEYINSVLQKAGAHVGYRVRDEIVFYLMNNKKNGLISEEEAFDNEIMQKILPRIQGSSSSVKTMLCDMFRYCAGDYTGLGGSSDSEQMQAYIDQKSKGKYPRSAEKIVFMTRRFEEDGFTSYWL